MKDETRQYRELAKYYDLLYQEKDYEKETRLLKGIIRRYKRSSGNSLLDVACGTGKHIQYLQHNFDCFGIDSSETMLEQARRNVEGLEFRRADMSGFDLGRRFDVALCLFSAIAYVKTYPRLARTLRNFSKHLKDGGGLIIEPWFTRSSWRSGLINMRTYRSGRSDNIQGGHQRTSGKSLLPG